MRSARILRGTWVQPREQWSEVAGGQAGIPLPSSPMFSGSLGSVCSDLDCARVVTQQWPMKSGGQHAFLLVLQGVLG